MQEGAPRAGIGRARIQEALRVAPCAQSSSSCAVVGGASPCPACIRAAGQPGRTPRTPPGPRPAPASSRRPAGRCPTASADRAVVGHQRHPQFLVDPRRQPIGAGQHQVDIDAPRVLLRLQLARQLRRRRLGEGDLRHQLRDWPWRTPPSRPASAAAGRPRRSRSAPQARTAEWAASRPARDRGGRMRQSRLTAKQRPAFRSIVLSMVVSCHILSTPGAWRPVRSAAEACNRGIDLGALT